MDWNKKLCACFAAIVFLLTSSIFLIGLLSDAENNNSELIISEMMPKPLSREILARGNSLGNESSNSSNLKLFLSHYKNSSLFDKLSIRPKLRSFFLRMKVLLQNIKYRIALTKKQNPRKSDMSVRNELDRKRISKRQASYFEDKESHINFRQVDFISDFTAKFLRGSYENTDEAAIKNEIRPLKPKKKLQYIHDIVDNIYSTLKHTDPNLITTNRIEGHPDLHDIQNSAERISNLLFFLQTQHNFILQLPDKLLDPDQIICKQIEINSRAFVNVLVENFMGFFSSRKYRWEKIDERTSVKSIFPDLALDVHIIVLESTLNNDLYDIMEISQTQLIFQKHCNNTLQDYQPTSDFYEKIYFNFLRSFESMTKKERICFKNSATSTQESKLTYVYNYLQSNSTTKARIRLFLLYQQTLQGDETCLIARGHNFAYDF